MVVKDLMFRDCRKEVALLAGTVSSVVMAASSEWLRFTSPPEESGGMGFWQPAASWHRGMTALMSHVSLHACISIAIQLWD